MMATTQKLCTLKNLPAVQTLACTPVPLLPNALNLLAGNHYVCHC
jgi:hypothetical protein